MKDIPNLFGSLVFNDNVMKARLPKETYKSLKNTIQAGKSLDLSVANAVANAMKDWAIEKVMIKKDDQLLLARINTFVF